MCVTELQLCYTISHLHEIKKLNEQVIMAVRILLSSTSQLYNYIRPEQRLSKKKKVA